MWPRIACVLLLGYLSVSRAFAYLGIPAWKLFISEVALALFLFAGPRVGGRRWMWVAVRTPILKRFWIWFALFLGYGIIHVAYGIKEGYPPLTSARDLAFNYYPFYFLLGLWAGIVRPDALPRLIRGFAWFNGIYGALFIFFLSRVEWFVPGVSDDVIPVPIFGQPIYSFVALLGLFAYEKSLWRSSHLLALNGFVMLGMQFRTEWLAFAIGAVTWCILTRQGKRVLQAGAILACLVALLYITDFSLPSPRGRAEADFSARQLVDRLAAPFRADLSDQGTAAGMGTVDSQEATFVWRTVWWLAIWNSVHEDVGTALWGHGYGYALGDLVPYLRDEFIRTPHNELLYALGYTGWIGVGIFVLFEVEILRFLWKAHRQTGEPFGLIYWMAITAFGMFFPLGETPYGAIPFYLITGWVVAPVVLGKLAIRDGTQPVQEVYSQGPRPGRPAVALP
jgi:hypothetical protein